MTMGNPGEMRNGERRNLLTTNMLETATPSKSDPGSRRSVSPFVRTRHRAWRHSGTGVSCFRLPLRRRPAMLLVRG